MQRVARARPHHSEDPSRDDWYIPLIRIDHVLVGQGVDVGTVETVRVSGQYAHLVLVAWLRAG